MTDKDQEEIELLIKINTIMDIILDLKTKHRQLNEEYVKLKNASEEEAGFDIYEQLGDRPEEYQG